MCFPIPHAEPIGYVVDHVWVCIYGLAVRCYAVIFNQSSCSIKYVKLLFNVTTRTTSSSLTSRTQSSCLIALMCFPIPHAEEISYVHGGPCGCVYIGLSSYMLRMVSYSCNQSSCSIIYVKELFNVTTRTMSSSLTTRTQSSSDMK